MYSATNAAPTLDNGTKVVAGTATFLGTKTFTADITGLTVGTTYHVRAYAMIDGVTYSTGVKDIVGGDGPQPMTWTGGKSPKQFSVSATQTVYFSQGNLQYMGSTGTWKFADHQFDFLGNNGQGSTSETADRDLFGWGTSGYNHGATCYQPWSTSTSYDYYAYGSYTNHLYSSDGTADWGANAISNGGGGSWRTLTGSSSGEWYYLIYSRPNAASLYGMGKVGSCTPGLIILPDDWKWEGDVAGFETSWKPGVSSWSNVYSYSDWAKMEAAGAVFLPAAGYRNGTSVDRVGSAGYYWSSSYRYSDSACGLDVGTADISPSVDRKRYRGLSVRLVSEN